MSLTFSGNLSRKKILSDFEIEIVGGFLFNSRKDFLSRDASFKREVFAGRFF